MMRLAGLMALALVVGILFTSARTTYAQASVTFLSGDLQSAVLDNPTSLQFGPDGRLYVAQQNGLIRAYTVARNAPGEYSVTATETINIIQQQILNHNDNGDVNNSKARQITSIMLAGSASTPVLYVTSSDWRISVGVDSGLDTNSGVISRLTCTGGFSSGSCAAWDRVDIVRGLPRSEENHSTNGMALDAANNTLYVMSGGNTNKGAPSGNFAGTPEYYLAAALLSVDLDAIESMPIYQDQRTEAKFVYDLPTLDDPTRTNITNSSPDFPYASNHPRYNSAVDPGDPFGGNDGLNMAIPEPGGPVQIYSPGYRNAFDVVYTASNRLYSVDNGGNSGWGGTPLIFASNGTAKGTGPFVAANGDYCTNGFNESNSASYGDVLHHISAPGYYGGHPAPIRAFPTLAGIPIYDKVDGTWTQVGATYDFEDLLPSGLSISNFPNQPNECDWTVDSLGLASNNTSTNGLAEYTASNFGGALQGNLLSASFNGNVNRYVLNSEGTAVTSNQTLFSGFGSIPLDLIAQDDGDIFPGTVWVGVFGSDKITVFEPSDYDGVVVSCVGNSDDTIDEDNDGYTNADELHPDNQTNPCSAGSMPSDNDAADGPEFNGFLRSDRLDTDDDNDGIPDVSDPFALDADNGLTTQLPINYPFWNNDPGTGLFGLGFTGLMSNGSTDYLDLYDENKIAAGGAAGLLTIEEVNAGDASGTTNTQQNAFQFGANVNTSTPPFIVHTRLRPPFFEVNGSATVPSSGQSYGLMIGTGDQSNFFAVRLQAAGGGAGIGSTLEVNNAPTNVTYNTSALGTLLDASQIDIYLRINPANQSVEVFASVNEGTAKVALGSAITLPAAWFSGSDNLGLAFGVISTAANSGTTFGATWDFLDVIPVVSSTLDSTTDPLDFGVVNQSTTEHSILTLVNLGDPLANALTINSVTIVGANASEFSHDFSGNVQLQPGSSHPVDVSFTPQSEGVKSATVNVTYNNNQTLAVPISATGAAEESVVVCLNAGGPNYAALNGWLFQAETYFTGGKIYLVGGSTQIAETEDDTIYRTERYGAQTWNIPVPAPGEYTVELYFTELWFGVSNTLGAGERFFDVNIEGTQVLNDYDIYVEAGGPLTAIVERFEAVNVTGSTVDIQLVLQKENAKISAICVLTVGAPSGNTPPQVAPINNQISQENVAVSLSVSAADADLDTLAYSATGLPPGLSINAATGQINGTINVGAATNSPYNVTVSVTDNVNPPVPTSFTWTVNTNGGGNASAWLKVIPNGTIYASTFGANSFQLLNTGTINITSVKIDLSTGILPDVVFDPVGTAGDVVAKCLTADAVVGTPGYQAPANNCVTPFSQPHNGVDNNEGYDAVTLLFNDFNGSEQFNFSVDIDPTSIKEDNTSGDAGSISGLEMVGATVTVQFADGSTVVTSLYEDGSLGGAQAVAAVNAPAAPTLSVLNVNPTPAKVSSLNQTLLVQGPPSANVSILLLDTRMHIDAGGGGYDIDPFEGNETIAKQLYSLTLNASGTGTIPVTLLNTSMQDGGPSGGLNYFIAVVKTGGNQTSQTSNVIVLEHDPQANTPPTITPISDKSVVAGTQLAVSVVASDADANTTLALSIQIVNTSTSAVLPAGEYSFTGTGNGTANFTWTPGANRIGNWTATVTASDGSATTQETFNISVSAANADPVANAGADQQVVDADGNGSETITLNGSGSSDDGTIQSYVWKENNTEIATGVTAQVNLSVGIHTIELTVTDNTGRTATDTVTITVLQQGVQLRINPTNSTALVDEIFSVVVQAQTGNQQVDGAEVHLNFDPALLQVMSLAPSSALGQVLQSEFDNSEGTIDFTAGTFDNFPAGTFDIVTVNFKAVAATGGSAILFADTAQRNSAMSFEGQLLPIVQESAGNVVITQSTTTSSLVGEVILQGRDSPPSQRWVAPVKVRFFEPGTNNMLYEFDAFTDQSGVFVLSNVPQGNFGIAVKNAQTLQSIELSTVAAGSNTIDFGVLLAGDTNNDNSITLVDFSLLVSTFNKMLGTANYDARADFNNDNRIDLSDFSLLASNFGVYGEESTATAQDLDQTVLGIRGTAEAQALLGKANLVAESLPEQVATGELFTMTIRVDAESQGVDGAEAHLDFDPASLEVVSLAGGSELDTVVLEPVFDNSAGTIDFAAGSLNGLRTGTFTFMTIVFKSKAEGEAVVTSSAVFPRQSNVTAEGYSVFGSFSLPTTVTTGPDAPDPDEPDPDEPDPDQGPLKTLLPLIGGLQE